MANRVEAAAITVAPLRQRFIKVLIKKRYLYLMMVPVLAWYLVFQYAPMYGIVLAFQDFRSRAASPARSSASTTSSACSPTRTSSSRSATRL